MHIYMCCYRAFDYMCNVCTKFKTGFLKCDGCAYIAGENLNSFLINGFNTLLLGENYSIPEIRELPEAKVHSETGVGLPAHKLSFRLVFQAQKSQIVDPIL